MMAISPSPFDRIPKTRTRGLVPWFAWALLACLLVGGALLWRPQAADLFWRVMAPLARVRESFGTSEVTRLREELAQANAALADRTLLYRENLDLKARLGRTPAQERVVAAVLQSPPWTPYDTLLVDAGEAQGVEVGNYVSAGASAFIGIVTEVYTSTARVELLSAPGASYHAFLNGTLPVVVEGQGGGSMQFVVPAGTPVKRGDTVSLPGMFGGVTALVSAVDEPEGASFVSVYTRLPVNLADVRFIELVTP